MNTGRLKAGYDIKEMAGDLLIDAIIVERILSEDKVCFLCSTSIREAVADEKDGVICFPVHLDKLLFTGSAKTAFLIKVREREIYSSFPLQSASIGIERDF